ncbi:MAG: zinc ribbon domain-containing protein [Myxococcota bacterium]|nr:zinc ribbon domain-containing protein [Myxococcota bacterium]MDW8361959.1 zinc ribbon domain-containing protein [Myxococcales bacterium]
MPLFELECQSCHHTFEELVSSGAALPPCPACASEDVAKRLSAFAVGSAGAEAAPAVSPCGRCGDPRGPGACRFEA